MVTIEYRNGIFYVDNARVTFPKDSQHQSAPVLMGLNYDNGMIVPASMTAEGKLNVGGVTLEGATVDVGDVVLIGRPEDVGRQKVSILDDGSGHGAMYVQSVNMATSAKQDAQSALLTTIDNSINSQINTPTSQLKTVLDTISATLTNQLDETTGNVYTALGVIDTSINTQVDMKTSLLGTKLDGIDLKLTTLNNSITTQTTTLDASIQATTAAINAQIDTPTSDLDTSIQAVTTAINTQVDTPTSTLNTSLGTINTSIGTTNTELATVNTNLGHLTDATQKTMVVDGSGNIVGATSNAMNVYMTGGVSLSVTLSHTTDSIAVWGTDGSVDRNLKTNVAGQLEVAVISSVLPTGASTEATLLNVATELGTVNTNLGTINTTLGTIKTDTGTLVTSNASIDTKLSDLISGNQKTKMVNDSGETIGINARPIFVDDSPMGKENITADYTYVPSGNGAGKVQTIKEYPTGAAGGSPAKLTTYSYNVDNKVTSIAVSDTTV